MKLIEMFDFMSARIVFDKFIDFDLTICEQEEMLTEDMFQAVFDKSNCLIDIGWIPEIDCGGSFRTMLVRKINWEEPLRIDHPKDYSELLIVLGAYLRTIDDIQDASTNG